MNARGGLVEYRSMYRDCGSYGVTVELDSWSSGLAVDRGGAECNDVREDGDAEGMD